MATFNSTTRAPSRATIRKANEPEQRTPCVYVYSRVSTGRQVDGDSLDAQRRVAEGYAIMKSKTIDETFSEEGISGSVALGDRPKGRELLAKVKRGDWIISPRLDRCFRSAIDALQVVEQLHERGVSLHLLDLGGDVSGNGVAKMFMTLAAAFAEFERHRIRERIAGSKADCRARNLFMGSSIQWGHRLAADGKTLEADPALAPALQKIARLRKRGVALRRIAETITRDGTKISHETVANVLRSQAAAHANGRAAA